MRVTMVITSYQPIVGGAERQAAGLARAMVAAGHSLTVITRHHPGLPRREWQDGVRVERVRAFGPKPLAAFAFLLGAARAVWRSRPDVVHCHSLFSPVLAGLLGGWLAGAPVLAKPMRAGEASGIAHRRLGRWRMALCRARLGAVVAISAEIRDELLALGFAPDRIACIPNGVDTDRFRPASNPAERTATRQALGLPEGTLFLYAGRIAPEKRLPMLLSAFRHLVAQRPEARLVIASARRAPGALAEGDDLFPDPKATPWLTRLGPVEDMAPLLQAVDALVLPSSREGLSNVLLEAGAAGLPTVAARIGGNVEIVEDGQTGLLFSPDAEGELAAALTRLASDPALRQTLGAAARDRIRQRFPLPATVDRLLALYRDQERAA